MSTARRCLSGTRSAGALNHSFTNLQGWVATWAAAVAAAGILIATAEARAADNVSTYRNGTNPWSNPAAWSPVGVPNNGASTYDAIFNGKYYGLGGDTLKLDLDITLQQFTMSGGYFLGPDSGGPHTLTLNDALRWTGGVIGGSTIIAKAGGTIAAATTCNLSGGTLDNFGTITYTASFASTPDNQLPLRLDSNTTLNNHAGATFDIAGDAGISITSASAQIVNQGTWIKSAGTGVSQVAPGFINTGSIQVQSGTLEFYADRSVFDGTATASAGTTLAFDGVSTFPSTSVIGGEGTIQLGEYVTFSGKLLGGSGALEVHNNGQIEISTGADLTSLGLAPGAGGRAFRLNAQGTASFDTGKDVAIYNLSSVNSFTPGGNTSLFITGADNIVLNGPSTWTGGTLAAPLTGPVNTVTVNAPMTLSGGGLGLDHRTLQNNSTINLTSGFIQAKHGATIDNAAGGVLEMGAGTRIDWFVAGPNALPAPVVNNAGLIIVSAGNGEAQFNDARLLNTGTVRVDSGMLTLYHSGAPGFGGSVGQLDSGINSGIYEIAAGATLNVSDHTMDPNSTVRGAGNMQSEGNYNYVQGTYDMSGTTTVYGGLAFQAGANLVNVGQLLNLTPSGGVTFDTGKPVTLRDVILEGSLGGSDPITIAGTLSGSGTLAGSNLIATGNVSPGNSPGTLTVQGKLTFTSSAQLTIELDNTSSDLLTTSSGLVLDGNLVLRLLDGYMPRSTDTFTVADGGTALSGMFNDVAPGQRLTTADGTGSFIVNYGPNSPFGPDVVVLGSYLAVPEPAAWGVLFVGASILFVRKRRIRRDD